MTTALDRHALDSQGAARIDACLDEGQLAELETALLNVPEHLAGVRIAGNADLSRLLQASGAIGRVASKAFDADAFPVRAVLFDKGPGNNWSLAWHQDRTIVVNERRETPGFGPWSLKAGLQHVAPPFEILETMKTVRVHLDPVDEDNAPLMIIPTSHERGRLSEAEVAKVARDGPTQSCLAERGDIWVYSTPIVHGSKLAARPRRRRVLQVDYSAAQLPGGLEWLGV